jgi:hypothetical protein
MNLYRFIKVKDPISKYKHLENVTWQRFKSFKMKE